MSPDQNTAPSPNGSAIASLDTEASLLGSLLLEPEVLISVADKLEADDFSDPRHQQIYKSISELFNSNQAIDLLTVSNQLRKEGLLEQTGGASYLLSLIHI